MNKLLRNQLKRKHYLRRIKLRALWNDVKWTQIYGAKWTNCYRTSGKPCSCSLCSPVKYSRVERNKWKEELKTLDPDFSKIIDENFWDLV